MSSARLQKQADFAEIWQKSLDSPLSELTPLMPSTTSASHLIQYSHQSRRSASAAGEIAMTCLEVGLLEAKNGAGESGPSGVEGPQNLGASP
jgi:hypothetical protein